MVKDKRILITGGLGFIGFNAVQYFARNNKVSVIDDCSRVGVESNIEQLKEMGVDFHHVDVVQFRMLKDAVYAIQPDVVIHLAGQVAVTNSLTNPTRDFNSNVAGTFNLLEVLRTRHEKPVLLFASTNKVYGSLSDDIVLKDDEYARAQGGGYDEETPLSFVTPYGCSKGAADQYCLDYAQSYGIPAVVLRQSCIYGPHQYGAEDQGWVAWFAICSAFSKPITIFGDGKQVRDALYVDDLVDLYEKCIDNIGAVSGQALNVGGGPSCTLSVNGLVSILEQRLGFALDVSYGDWREGDQRVFICDVGKAKALLGWEPSIRPSEGVYRLLEWIEAEKDHIREVDRKLHEKRTECEVSLVIPARNEEECIASVLDEVQLEVENAPYRTEVILVDDRSTDRTAEIAGAYPFVRIVPSRYKPGKGGALRSGFEEAKGAYIAMMDADFSHNVSDLFPLVDEAKRNKCLVIASRITGGSEEYTRMRGFGNVILTWFFGFVHSRYLSDVLNGYKVFHRDIFTTYKYTSAQFEIEIELAVNALRLGRGIVEFPSRERARMAGRMKSSVLKHGPRFFWRIILEKIRRPKVLIID